MVYAIFRHKLHSLNQQLSSHGDGNREECLSREPPELLKMLLRLWMSLRLRQS